jgi:hypothetical protein
MNGTSPFTKKDSQKASRYFFLVQVVKAPVSYRKAFSLATDFIQVRKIAH